MAGFSDYSGRAALDWMTGKAAMPALTTSYLALFTTMPNDDGTGGVEVTGGGYARIAVPAASWASASGTSPATVSNTAAATFATSTAAWGTIVGWGLYSAASAGNLKFADVFGNFSPLPFTATLASPSVFTAPAHGYANGDTVILINEIGGGSLPTGFTAGASYTVAGVTATTFTLGTAATTAGSGLVKKVTPQATVANLDFTFPAGAFTITAA